jgi:hypothetical protein
MLCVFGEFKPRLLDYFDTDCNVNNERRLLTQTLRNLIGIGLEVNKLGDHIQLEESF